MTPVDRPALRVERDRRRLPLPRRRTRARKGRHQRVKADRMNNVLHALTAFFDHLRAIAWTPVLLALLCQLAKTVARTRAWRNVLAAAYPEARVRWRSVFGASVAGARRQRDRSGTRRRRAPALSREAADRGRDLRDARLVARRRVDRRRRPLGPLADLGAPAARPAGRERVAPVAVGGLVLALPASAHRAPRSRRHPRRELCARPVGGTSDRSVPRPRCAGRRDPAHAGPLSALGGQPGSSSTGCCGSRRSTSSCAPSTSRRTSTTR